jgi:uroporphyrinogen-III synthase
MRRDGSGNMSQRPEAAPASDRAAGGTPAPCDLAGRGVLVTRPAAQAEGLCRLIAAAGGRALRLPTIEIEPPADPAAATTLLAQRWDVVIFISRNAVDGALALAPEALRSSGAKLAAVGRATAGAMDQAGLPPTLVPGAGFDSEALLALPALDAVAGQRVLIVRGEGGRALLGETLAARGAEVRYAEVYRRAAATVDVAALLPAWREELHLLTATSDAVLDNLLALLPPAAQPWLKGLPLAVLGPRNAETARSRGFAQVAVAPDTSDHGMLRALCTLVGQQARRA